MNPSLEPSHTIRIIAGRHRGRKLTVINQPRLRPSPNRARETVGNWLQFELPGATLLDAFAGTGAMGLEALSRGAASVLFNDTNAASVNRIRATLSAWKEPHGRVTLGDALLLRATSRYDIIFLDPPFSDCLHQAVLNKFATDQWLKSQGKLYLEMPFPTHELILPPGWQWLKSSRAGQVHFGLIGREKQ